MEALIGINKNDTGLITDILNVLRADQHILYNKLRNYHWNIVGNLFLELHEFLKRLYIEMADQIDPTAERIRMLGKNPMGSCEEFLQFTNLNETKVPYHEPKKILELLLSDFESLKRWLRDHMEKISESQDFGTEDFMVALIRSYEKTAWMLRAYQSK